MLETVEAPAWGPTGKAVYERTYQRVKPNGEKETWGETVERVVTGNLSLVYGDPETWNAETVEEFNSLSRYMYQFKVLPAGRHLWASGVKGRQYLFNCHVSGWTDRFSDHFEFTFMRLMEGGGVGANYSSRFLKPYGAPKRALNVHLVCSEDHPDYDTMRAAGVLSEAYDADWAGAYEVEDSREGWAAALVDLLDTFMQDREPKHENRVFDVSNIREAGRRLKTSGGTASGPAPFARMMLDISAVMNEACAENIFFGEDMDYISPLQAMDIDHAIASCVVAGGNRRSARMAMVEWDDPYIFDFLKCKEDTSKHWSTNISVAIDDDFLAMIQEEKHAYSESMLILEKEGNPPAPVMCCDAHIGTGTCCGDGEAVCYCTGQDLEAKVLDQKFEPKVSGKSSPNISEESSNIPAESFSVGSAEWARKVHREAVERMLENGEPGYWNRSLSQHGEVQEVVCTNPCGEITLTEFENCNLGHVNLQAFVDESGDVDWDGLDEAHALMTRFLIRATYGDVNDARQARVLELNRRIGVGHFGVQGFLVKQGIRWSDAVREGFGHVLARLYTGVRACARVYCFELRLPEPVKVSTVAPTGTIAKLAGAGEGIHPVYARHFIRRVRFSMVDPDQRAQLSEFARQGFKVEKDTYAENTWLVEFPTKDSLVAEIEGMGLDSELVESVDQISLETMLEFQAMYQATWADNAVSFTANVPEGRYTADEVSELLAEWLPRLKGTTLMPDGTRPQAPYERLSAEEYSALGTGLVSDGIDEECANGACPVR